MPQRRPFFAGRVLDSWEFKDLDRPLRAKEDAVVGRRGGLYVFVSAQPLKTEETPQRWQIEGDEPECSGGDKGHVRWDPYGLQAQGVSRLGHAHPTRHWHEPGEKTDQSVNEN